MSGWQVNSWEAIVNNRGWPRCSLIVAGCGLCALLPVGMENERSCVLLYGQVGVSNRTQARYTLCPSFVHCPLSPRFTRLLLL